MLFATKQNIITKTKTQQLNCRLQIQAYRLSLLIGTGYVDTKISNRKNTKSETIAQKAQRK
jgi:hypothetical protein